ncbi:MAG: hypothetical protein JO307_00275 [Bryobacterales bacterium]|nr:hypothetical protein [Bryobacterales bacterium]MBV9401555.1 hypothetical protein [Bryobacterales bacterium]
MSVAGPGGAGQAVQVRAQLDKLVQAPALASSPRRQQLLRFLIEHWLQGRGDQLTEYGIALDVFGRPPSFDPRLDSIVRTEASRLRQKLVEYYAGEGKTDTVLIEIPKRSYIPAVTFRPATAEPEPPLQVRRSPGRLWLGAGAGLGGFLVIAAIAGIVHFRSARGTAPPVGSVVVLPFQNLSPNSENEYLADGVTEELTNELSQWPDLRVVARTSAFQFKGKGKDIREIGRELGVSAALEGSVQRTGGTTRITAQLNRTSDGYHLWSRSFEVTNRNLAEAQAEISSAVAMMLAKGEPARAVRLPNAEAHDLYLRGYYQFSLRTPQSQQASLELFHRAIAADPSYVAPYIGIARAEIAQVHITAEAPMEGLEPIRAALQKAIEIDPSAAEARGLMGFIYYTYDWDWPKAEQQYRLALQEGAQAGTHSSYAWGLATRGRFREAQEQFQIAQDLDPLGEGPRVNQFFAYYLEHDFARGRLVLEKLLDMNPDLLDAKLLLGLTAAIQHDCGEAAAEFEAAARKYDMPVTKFGLAAVAACRGDDATARKLLLQMAGSRPPAFASPYQLALGYAFLHDREAALAQLQKSASVREGQILYLKYEPVFEQIRSDPRYLALERRVGLE